MTHGSLFSGIGGFDLGFERAGFKTVWQVEIDPFCRRVLTKHFPEAERFEDVRECGRRNLRWVDVLSLGFPCQDISNAGGRAGISGTRSGLWSEGFRIIGELRPKIVTVENVAALLVRGIERVCGDLAEIGYDAEWDCLPASAFGAPHRRDRVFLVAYPHRCGCGQPYIFGQQPRRTEIISNGEVVAHSASFRREGSRMSPKRSGQEAHGKREATNAFAGSLAHQWSVEPDVGRVANGISARVDRLKGLGNAVVPQIAQWIAERIKQALLTGE